MVFAYITTILFSCNKSNDKTSNNNNSTTKKTTQQLARESAGLVHLSNQHNDLSWDIELMDDTTWSGDMITPETTYVTPFLDFALDFDIEIEEVNNDLVVSSDDPDDVDFILNNFRMVSSNTYTFDAVYDNEVITTYTVISDEIESTNDLKASFVGNWAANGLGEKPAHMKITIGVIWGPVIWAVVTITKAYTNHCTDIVKVARSNCNTPPCSFIAHSCSAECKCPEEKK